MDPLSHYMKPYAKKIGIDEELIDQILDLSNDVVEHTKLKELAPKFEKEGPTIQEDGWVKLPTGHEEVYREFGEAGLYGIFVPEEYGGNGLPYTLYTGFTEIVSRACGSTGLGVAVIGSVLDILLAFGNEEQKQKYIPDIASGKKIGSVCFSEPGAGSDLANAKTTARYEDGHFVLNGQKQWITNGGFSDVYIVYARTDPEKGKKGFSQFILEKGMKGFTVDRLEKKYGLEAQPTAVLNFDNVIVPEENLLGTRGEGLKQTILGLSGGERIGVAAWATGIAAAAYAEAIEYTELRHAFGQPIKEFPIIKRKLETMKKQLHLSRETYIRAGVIKDTTGPFTIEASIAKLYGSEAAIQITYQNQQVHGGNGISRDYPAERHVRDVRTATIGGGTSEIQQLIITRYFKNENVHYKNDEGDYELWEHPSGHVFKVPKGLIEWDFWGVTK